MVDWIQVGQASGSGDTQVLVRATPNNRATVRDTTLVLSGITKHINIDVEQETTATTSYLTFNILGGGTINWKTYSNNVKRTIYYNINNTTWRALTSSEAGVSINVNSGDIVWFKGDNETYGRSNNYIAWNTFCGSTATFSLCGNIMSLIDSENFSNLKSFSKEFVFYYLFSACTVVEADELALPATALTNDCYFGMFEGCTSLITVPELPAKIMKQWCYAYMFAECSSLNVTPELPSTELALCCYRAMFSYCTSLTRAPELPAPVLAEQCYIEMFNHCSSLFYVKCLATNMSARGCLNNWLRDTSSNGVFVKASSATWPTGKSGIPEGWTVIDAT